MTFVVRAANAGDVQPLYEMAKEGIDLNSIQWQMH